MAFPEIYDPLVTDHAMVRWLERYHLLDLRQVRQEILADGRREWVAQGARFVHVPEISLTLVADQGRVVDVLKSRRGWLP